MDYANIPELSLCGQVINVVGKAADFSQLLATNLYGELGLGSDESIAWLKRRDYLSKKLTSNVVDLIPPELETIYLIKESPFQSLSAVIMMRNDPLNPEWTRGLVFDYQSDSSGSLSMAKVIPFTPHINVNLLRLLGLEAIIENERPN
jgi:hypothetical protein